jgi:hypothetical protein
MKQKLTQHGYSKPRCSIREMPKIINMSTSTRNSLFPLDHVLCVKKAVPNTLSPPIESILYITRNRIIGLTQKSDSYCWFASLLVNHACMHEIGEWAHMA